MTTNNIRRMPTPAVLQQQQQRINAPEKVRRDDPKGNKLVFDAKWDVDQTPPNTKVGLTAVCRVIIEDAGDTALIKVFQLLNGQRIAVGQVFKAPFENGQIKAEWTATPAKGGDFEAGEYHYEVWVGSNYGQTSQGLLLRDMIVNHNASKFVTKKPPLIKGIF